MFFFEIFPIYFKLFKVNSEAILSLVFIPYSLLPFMASFKKGVLLFYL